MKSWSTVYVGEPLGSHVAALKQAPPPSKKSTTLVGSSTRSKIFNGLPSEHTQRSTAASVHRAPCGSVVGGSVVGGSVGGTVGGAVAGAVVAGAVVGGGVGAAVVAAA